MSDREEVQRKHELAVMNLFVDWLGRQEGVQYELIEQPDPPDGIYRSSNGTIWIEVADTYRSADEAHEERSRATAGERPFVHTEHPIPEPDERMATAMVNNIAKKISKESYRPVLNKYGRGILICCERDPLFDESTIQRIVSKLREQTPVLDKADKGFFKELYLYARARDFMKLGEFQ